MLILSTAVSVVVGFVAGLLSVGTSEATTTYTVELMGAGNAYINCGWHGACGTIPTSGTAIDWLDYGDHYIYFRVFAYRASGSQATVAEATVDQVYDGVNCHAVYMDISSPSGVTYRGSEEYLHTTTTANGNPVDIVANTTGYWTQSQFASTLQWIEPGHVKPEPTNCAWDGPHSHQFSYWENVSSSSRNTTYFPSYVNAESRDIDVQGHYQDRASWAY
jgi:hypothetical protein